MAGAFSWKYPDAIAEGDLNLEMYKSLARTAERGCLDVIFLADGYSTKDDALGPEALRSLSTTVHFEPLTLLGVLSTVTSHIGLVCNGLDHVQPALRPGPPHGDARPSQRRPRRLEPDHLADAERGAQFRL